MEFFLAANTQIKKTPKKRGRTVDKRTVAKNAKVHQQIFDDIMEFYLNGNFGPQRLLDLSTRYKQPIPQIRTIAISVSQLLQQLQQISDDPLEAKQIKKAEIVQKLHSLLETAVKKSDLKAANLILTNISKLYGLYEDENTLKLTNNFSLFSSKFSEEELDQVKKSFKLPDSIVQDYKNQLNAKPDDNK